MNTYIISEIWLWIKKVLHNCSARINPYLTRYEANQSDYCVNDCTGERNTQFWVTLAINQRLFFKRSKSPVGKNRHQKQCWKISCNLQGSFDALIPCKNSKLLQRRKNKLKDYLLLCILFALRFLVFQIFDHLSSQFPIYKQKILPYLLLEFPTIHTR